MDITSTSSSSQKSNVLESNPINEIFDALSTVAPNENQSFQNKLEENVQLLYTLQLLQYERAENKPTIEEINMMNTLSKNLFDLIGLIDPPKKLVSNLEFYKEKLFFS